MNSNKFWGGFIAGCLVMAIVFSGIQYYKYRNNETVGTITSEAEDEDQGIEIISSGLSVLDKYIDKFYLEDLNEDGISEQDLIEGAYKGYIEGLGDVYSTYYTAEEYKALQESTSGEYSGIGVTVTADEDTGAPRVVSVNKEGPSYKAGVKADDLIVKVDGEDITGQDLDEVVSKMKGDENTKVEIQVYRASTNEYLDFEIVRKKIEVETVTYEMLDDDIAHVTISAFDTNTDEHFSQVLEKTKKEGAKAYIFDVRNNLGGNYETVCNMLDELLPEGTIVYTMDKNGDKEEQTSDAACLDMPMAVLINGYSASASEIFAGAIKDFKAGTIIGTQSFGKGIVQGIYPLSNGGALKLTISRYYTPSGVNIHGTGITPDKVVELDEDKKGDEQLSAAVKELTDK